jgi:hypothetical protein
MPVEKQPYVNRKGQTVQLSARQIANAERKRNTQITMEQRQRMRLGKLAKVVLQADLVRHGVNPFIKKNGVVVPKSNVRLAKAAKEVGVSIPGGLGLPKPKPKKAGSQRAVYEEL